MKNKLFCGLVLLTGFGVSTALAASPDKTSDFSPVVRVAVDSEASDLAKGFEAAFAAAATRPPVSLLMIRDGKTFVLEDVSKVQASAGALRVEVGKGVTYILNSRDVLCITDGKVPVAK